MKYRLMTDRHLSTDTGRSMVEMLGVLAIMGVLSVGGMVGYQHARDKYSANEILNEVQKRVVTISQQRISGQPINLSEYGNNTIQGHPVTTADNYEGDSSFFTLTVSGIEKNVCNKVIKEEIPFVVTEKVGNVIVKDDVTCAEGENAVTFVLANTLDGKATPTIADPACKGVTCPEGSSCSNGFCLCSTGLEVCGEICCPSGQMCSSSFAGCVNVIGCLSNADCDSGEYCSISATKDASETTCYKEYSGTCTTLGGGTATEVAGVGMVYRSNAEVGSWWSAKNWCQAHGKRLMNIGNNRLGCYRESDGTTPFGETTTGYCCAEGQAGCSDDQTKQSVLMQELRTKLSSGTVWLETDYSSCVASYMLLSIGGIGNSRRDYNDYALCEEITVSDL